MKIIKNEALINKYLKNPPYTDYFQDYFQAYTKVIDFEAGELVLQQSVPPDYLYLMTSGRCNVRLLLTNGKSVILQTLKAPCLIGEMELMHDISSFTVQALEKCRMLGIPLKECREYLLNDTFFLHRLCSDLIYKERKEALVLVRSFAYPFENRLAKFILDNCQGNYFLVKKVQIAESLGVSYRHVETVMNDFVQKKYLSKQKLIYTITDRNALTDLAEELYPENMIGKL